MAQQEMLPQGRVLVSAPTTEHQRYLNAPGRIIDVRDYPPVRFCQVELDDFHEPIWFESAELVPESVTRT